MEQIQTRFVGMTGNQWLEQMSREPRPEQLWRSLWYKNEVSCLFADTNVGKSILAVQIANDIAERERVLYFDFEMSGAQFFTRYTNPADGSMAQFNPGFARFEMSHDIDDLSLDTLIADIECEVERWQASVVVIDNITWLCDATEYGDEAGQLMKMLIALKRRKSLSILVLAHTPKRPANTPLTQNSLAGSKKLANFFDSIFAIGVDSHSTPAGRYIKQIKVRSSEKEYGDDSVIRAELVKDDAWLRFALKDTAPESALIGDTGQRNQEILQMRQDGKTYDEIASALKVSRRDIAKAVASVR